MPDDATPCSPAASIRRSMYQLPGLMLGLALLCGSAQGQQLPRSTDGSDPAGWDPRLSALLAATGNHKVVYEDESIRILSVMVPVGSEEPLHWHPYYSVLVFDQPVRIANRDAAGRTFDGEFITLQRTPSGVPFVGVQAPEAPHSIRNLDNVDLHLTRIEFKKGVVAPRLVPPFWGKGPMPPSTDGTDPRHWNPREEALAAASSHHRVVYEDASIRILSVTDAPGSVEPPHRHPLPSVLVFDLPTRTVLHGADGKVLGNDVGPEHRPTLMMLPPQGLHWVSNDEPLPAHLTRIEFKRGFPH